MKALVYSGTMQSEIREMALADIGAGEVIVDVHQCGICGSDMHAWHGLDDRRIPPLILGHEAVGRARAGRFAGQRVVINPLMSCDNCHFCQTGAEHLCASRELVGMRVAGAFAEQVIVKEDNLTVISDNLSDSNAALAEPLACAVNAAQLAIAHIPDSTANVHVLGGGAIGLLAAMVFSAKGYSNIHIAETNALRRNILTKIGNFNVYDPLAQRSDDGQIDIVLDAVGSGRSRAAASAMVRPGGVISHIGLQDNEAGLDTRRITLQQIHFTGSYCYSRNDFADAVQLLEDGFITGSGWVEVRELEAGAQSFVDIHEGKAPPKIILNMSA
ncbi:MAG: alcohol dehydrogenase catalytic domain-containing protein [Alphaproteobacteria bacterium]|nr:alcohol dehydrogenase catalytic domain-containing protein [Alphaproteobacteria bacterium]MBL6776405.1 alcohol dehydrogenase catalytic domain-containing protein [Alphaproteobacteria bacterium]